MTPQLSSQASSRLNFSTPVARALDSTTKTLASPQQGSVVYISETQTCRSVRRRSSVQNIRVVDAGSGSQYPSRSSC